MRVEPHFEPRLHENVNEHTGQMHSQIESNDQRGDLLLIRHNQRLLIDVTVRRPTGQTEMRVRDSHSIPLATAAAAEKKKHAKYDEACARDGVTMVPFAMESYGAKGKEAQKLLLKLADASDELSASGFLRHASAALSVALQCGNADISARGTQSLRVHQAAAAERTGGHGGGGITSSAASAGHHRRRQRVVRLHGEQLQVTSFHGLLHAAAAAPVVSSRAGRQSVLWPALAG